MRAQLAPGTRCVLEHGGATPVIVAANTNFDNALPKLLKGGFYYAGHVCVSVQRIFVHRSRECELATGLADMASVLRVGDPKRENSQVGPIDMPCRGGKDR